MGSDVPPLDALGQLANLLDGFLQLRIELQCAAIQFQGRGLVAIFLQQARQFGHGLEMPRIEQHHFLQGHQGGGVIVGRMFHARADVPALGKVRRDIGDGLDQFLGRLVVGGRLGGLRPLDQQIDTGAAGNPEQGLKLLLNGMGVFPQHQLDLNVRDDGRFDANLRARERNGFGDGVWESVFLFFRGIPFQQVSPSYFNIRRYAINFDSSFRWDAQKRRVFAELSGPLEHGAKYRWELTADLRNENWALRNGFTGPAPVLADFNLRKSAGAIDFASYASGRYGWRIGAEISHRDLRAIAPGVALTTQMMAAGYELKQKAEISGVLWRMPEHRFQFNAGATSGAARLWSPTPQTFEKLTGSVGWSWLPQARGDDYATMQTLRAGRIFGPRPFDELFILGLERDNDLPMRAHIGTRDGRKGSAPLGREYLLENWEIDKNLYGNGLVALKLGPFVDLGKINDSDATLGSHKWLFDTGAQLKLRAFGSGLAFSYGKDLRTGNNAFYLRLLE